MMQTPVIVTFANQKGGVGKTTLCVSFANYLVTKGVRVTVLDCDMQRSIIKSRQFDSGRFSEIGTPYDVISGTISSKKAVTEMTARLHNDPSIEVALIDCPGSLSSDGLIALMANSDIIAVPFHYDTITLSSTAGFLLYLSGLYENLPANVRPSLFIIPNLNDKRVGKRSELILWDLARDTFVKYGCVTPKIGRRALMERISTVVALDRNLTMVSPVFDLIYASIFDTTDPRREYRLTGLQLTENYEAMEAEERKRKEKEEDDS